MRRGLGATGWLAALGLLSVPAVMLNDAMSYGIRLVTALLGAAVLLRPGLGGARRLRRARRLLAAALCTGAVSGLLAAVYLLVTGTSPPAGWWDDWVYLAYVPLAVTGLLALPAPSRGTHPAWRSLVDGLLAASALTYLVLVTVPPRRLAGLPAPHVALVLLYPACPVLVGAVLLSALGQQRNLRPFVMVQLGAWIALAVGDLGYALATAQGRYHSTSWAAAAGQAALVLFVLAAQRLPRDAATEEAPPVGLLGAVAPFLPILPGVLATAALAMSGRSLTTLQLLPVMAMGTLVVGRHLVSAAEHRAVEGALVLRERSSAAQARTDELTGLGNRRALQEALRAALALPGPDRVALLLLDLDDFKSVNDTQGHDAGDEVLRAVARRLSGAVPAGAQACRLGGDEFAVLARGAGAEHARGLGAAIAAALSAPSRTSPYGVRASVGVVVSEPGDTASVLLAHADVAMYEAKATPGRTHPVVLLEGEDRRRAAQRVQLREELAQPDLARFSVAYQPVVDAHSGRIVAVEALLRWCSIALGDVPPAVFVPVAESVGSIGVLGRFVLRRALADLVAWQRAAPGTELSVTVNVSPHELVDPYLAGEVRAALQEAGVSPQRLVLEITEEALLEDWTAAQSGVQALRDLGVSLAVDDFGTGYSSLRYLRRFSPDIVKIDREFVVGVAEDPRTRALVASVLQLSAALGLVCVAEGVETAAQLAVLRQDGCTRVQGYLFARPEPAARLQQRLREQSGATPPAGSLPQPRPA